MHMSFFSLILCLRGIEFEVHCFFLAWQEKGSDIFSRLSFLFHPEKMKSHQESHLGLHSESAEASRAIIS